MAHQGFFRELRRRHIFRVAIAYAVTAWLLLQLAAIVLPTFDAPHWILKVLIGVFVLFFPIALIVAWAYEMTPEGVRRTVPAEAEEARPEAVGRRLGRKIDFMIIGVLTVAVALLLTNTLVWHKGVALHGASVPASSKSIAVLPFENLSSDQANAYFSDGIQDLILTKLADIGDLAVISRTSSMRYGSHPEDLQTVGKELGVATILEGSVQRIGDQVLINVQLINVRNDHHIWANSYTRTLKNVFSVEGEVASKIASTLNAKLSPAETQRLATTLSGNTEANDLYLRGNYFANRASINYDTVAMKQASTYYRQAIAKAPDFAEAHAGLSIQESELAWFGGGGENAAPLYADSLTQAEQALMVAPDLADAHLAMGYYDYWGKGDYSAALKAFSAALALRPNDSGALAAKGFVLRRQGKFNDAIGAFNKALALDPRNTFLANETGETYMSVSRYPQAERAFQRALALDPTNDNAKIYYSSAIVYRTGDLTRAMAEVDGDDSELKMLRINLLTFARKYSDALYLLQSIPDTPDTFGSSSYGPKSLNLAYLYHLSGNATKARVFYAKALPEARAQYAALKGSPLISQGRGLVYVAFAELGLGRTAAGLADIAKTRAIAEHTPDHMYGPGLLLACAQGYANAGRPNQAVSLLSKALAEPGIGNSSSPVMLWINPVWDPIRRTPGFQALLRKYAKYRPEKVYEDPNK